MEKANNKKFSKDILEIENIQSFIDKLVSKLKHDVYNFLRRKGGVVGISGGIDSSVTLALAVQAFGSDNVFGVMMPEKDSSADSAVFAKKLADQFNIKSITEDIKNALVGFGCYTKRDEAVKSIFPEYDPESYKMKIGIKKSSLTNNLPPIFSLTIVDKNGNEKSKLLPVKEYLQIVAASNFKQRSRMAMLYYYAESKHYAVIGTPNKHETEQGFFVKFGDGGADVMPIGNLYKTQVYQIARFLDIPPEIINRTPTTDTYSAEQTQEEFFFQLPFNLMDLLWYAYENNCNISEVSSELNLTEDEILRVFSNFTRKKKTTEYLKLSPIRDY